jgi:DNA-binding SARP family transcriptional activator
MRAMFHFGVLGPLVVERDEVVVDVSAARQRTLLAVLLGAGEPLSRDRLIDAVWGEWAPAREQSARRLDLRPSGVHVGA